MFSFVFFFERRGLRCEVLVRRHVVQGQGGEDLGRQQGASRLHRLREPRRGRFHQLRRFAANVSVAAALCPRVRDCLRWSAQGRKSKMEKVILTVTLKEGRRQQPEFFISRL